MAATAQAQSVVALEPTWDVAADPARRRPRWPWGALAAGGATVLVAATVAVAVVFNSSVGSGESRGSGAGAPSTDLGALARSYAGVTTAYENAERAWKARADRMVSGSASSAEALIRPTVQFADAVDGVAHDLAGLSWPPSVRADVGALEADLAILSGDLRSIGGQSVSSMAQWASNVVGDASRSSVASDRLGRDLGGTTILPMIGAPGATMARG
ncbi:MAG TPA: hypothetical protein VG476_07390 [Acidimicrobiales bacterium]|nr:hypothetical protein [Acidimicrobiales bacterium]